MSVSASSASVSPNAPTLSNLRKSVLDIVQGGSDPELLDLADRAIKQAIDRLNLRTWQWSIETQSITLDTTNDEYTVNADFKMPYKAELLDSNSKRAGMLNYLTPRQFLDWINDTTNGSTPYYYTVISPHADGKIRLDLVPDSAYTTKFPTLRLNYYSRVVYPAGVNDAIDVPSEVGAFLVWYGREEVATMRGDLRAADRARARWTEMERRLRADDEDFQTDY
jgi:hypothetical protein